MRVLSKSVLLLGVSAATLAPAQFTFNQIAISGETAPGADDGAVYQFFDAPALNATGDVAFEAYLSPPAPPGASPNGSAILGPTNGSGSPLGIVARSDQVAPGTMGLSAYQSFGNPVVSRTGDVAFQSFLKPAAIVPAGVSEIDGAIFGPSAGPGSPLGVLARVLDSVPGAADQARFNVIENRVAMNASGDVVFSGSLAPGEAPDAPPVTGDNSLAIFGPTAGVGSPRGIVVREGDLAPGTDDLSVFDGVGWRISTQPSGRESPALNDAGDIAFRATLRTGTAPGATPVTSENNHALYGPIAGPESPLGIIARGGDPAPGATDFADYLRFPSNPALNEGGDVAFTSVLQTGAGPGATPVTSENQFAVVAPTAGAGSPLAIVARQGDVAPGTTDFAQFSSFGFPSFLDAPSLNNAGELAFLATLVTGAGAEVTTANDQALYTHSNGVLELVFREGDVVPVTTPDGLVENRAVNGIIFTRSGLNDAGELAVSLFFTDRTQGIFILSPIPEPTSAALALLAAGLGIARFPRTTPQPAA